MRSRTLPAVAIALVALAGLSASLPPTGDAGTSGDAGDTPATALAIGYGAYAGYQHNPKDADWYTFPPLSAVRCVEASASAAAAVDLNLAIDGFTASTTVPESGRVVWGYAAAGSHPLLGFTPTVNPAMHTPSRPGTYMFETRALSSTDLGSGDGGSGGDAGSKKASAIPLSRPCFAGSLALPSGDDSDVYSFAGVVGHRVTITFQRLADGDAYLTLLSPTGAELAEIDDDRATVTLPSTGTYYLAVTEAGDTSGVFAANLAFPSSSLIAVPYLAGYTDDAGGQGCRPMCLK